LAHGLFLVFRVDDLARLLGEILERDELVLDVAEVPLPEERDDVVLHLGGLHRALQHVDEPAQLVRLETLAERDRAHPIAVEAEGEGIVPVGVVIDGVVLVEEIELLHDERDVACFLEAGPRARLELDLEFVERGIVREIRARRLDGAHERANPVGHALHVEREHLIADPVRALLGRAGLRGGRRSRRRTGRAGRSRRGGHTGQSSVRSSHTLSGKNCGAWVCEA
jgi:hypothetical protein